MSPVIVFQFIFQILSGKTFTFTSMTPSLLSFMANSMFSPSGLFYFLFQTPSLHELSCSTPRKILPFASTTRCKSSPPLCLFPHVLKVLLNSLAIHSKPLQVPRIVSVLLLLPQIIHLYSLPKSLADCQAPFSFDTIASLSCLSSNWTIYRIFLTRHFISSTA